MRTAECLFVSLVLILTSVTVGIAQDQGWPRQRVENGNTLVYIPVPGLGVRADSDWDHFYGPGWDNAVAAVPTPTTGAMSFTDTLPDDVTTVEVGGQTYYVSKGVYYQECFMGSDVNYCVVPAPK